MNILSNQLAAKAWFDRRLKEPLNCHNRVVDTYFNQVGKLGQLSNRLVARELNTTSISHSVLCYLSVLTLVVLYAS